MAQPTSTRPPSQPGIDSARIARQPLRRFCGDARAAYDHLVSLARGAAIDAMLQRRLREEAQRFRLLLAHRRLLRDADH